MAPKWDCIYQTPFWDVAHCFGTDLPGWLVLVLRRHVPAVDQLTDGEAVELGQLIRRTSQAIKEVCGCMKTYVVQFAEHESHQHVHFHIIPRMADQAEDRKGPLIFGALGVPEANWVSEETMNSIALKIRAILEQHHPA